MRSLMRLGLAPRVEFELDSEALAELTACVESAAGRDGLTLAFSVGPPRPAKRFTAVAIDDRGAIVAFAKIASNSVAASMLSRETAVLGLLEATPIGSRVPTVLHSFEWRACTVLVTAPGPAARGPRGPGPLHTDFLTDLAAAAGRETTFAESATGRALRSAVEASSDGGHATWTERLKRVHEYLASRFEDQVFPGGLAHHDFAPWNTRRDSRGLWVLDWEGAEHVDLPLLDAHHFTFATAALLGRSEPGRWLENFVARQIPSVRRFRGELRLAYLAGLCARASNLSPAERSASAILERACQEIDSSVSRDGRPR